MPSIEVRTLDLINQVATPMPLDSDPISTQDLNYVWVYVEDAAGNIETHLRFKVVAGRFILRPDTYPDAVKAAEAEFQRNPSDRLGEIEWLATMVHYPLRDVARIESGAIAVGDALEVGPHPVRDESSTSLIVDLGTVTKIVLTLP